ncbi:hypothetical protein CLOP_g770 [Closterium sp. NIES-67]|nr:hypothetical protein CLOP_g770 [Closterium sp. NIES-67]
MGSNHRRLSPLRRRVTPCGYRCLPASPCFPLLCLLLALPLASTAATAAATAGTPVIIDATLHPVTGSPGSLNSAQPAPSVPSRSGQSGQISMLTVVSGCPDERFSCPAPVTVVSPSSRAASCLRIPQFRATRSFKIDWLGESIVSAALAAAGAASNATETSVGVMSTPAKSTSASSRLDGTQSGQSSGVRTYICQSLVFWSSVNCSPLEPSFAVAMRNWSDLISTVRSTPQCSSNGSSSVASPNSGSAGESAAKPSSKVALESRGVTSAEADSAPEHAAGPAGARLRGGIDTIRVAGGAIGAPFSAPQQMGIRSISCETLQPIDASTFTLLFSSPAPCAPPSIGSPAPPTAGSSAPPSGSRASAIPGSATGISATSSSSITSTTYSSSQPVPANETATSASASSDTLTLFALAVAAVLASVCVLAFVGAAFYFAPESAMRTAAAAAAAATAAASIAAEIAASTARHARSGRRDSRNSPGSPDPRSSSSPSAPLRSSRSPSSSSSASSLSSLGASASSSSSSSLDSRSSRSPSQSRGGRGRGTGRAGTEGMRGGEGAAAGG